MRANAAGRDTQKDVAGSFCLCLDGVVDCFVASKVEVIGPA